MGNCLQPGPDNDMIIPQDHEGSGDYPQVDLPPPYYERTDSIAAPHQNEAVYHPSPSDSRHASELTEEEQIKIAQRIGLIQHCRELEKCVICMTEFSTGDAIRFLPCLHTYHAMCIDDWLMRSFTCPSCMEPVDAALLTTYHSHGTTQLPSALPRATPPTSW